MSQQNHRKLNRRSFLKLGGGAVALTALTGTLSTAAVQRMEAWAAPAAAPVTLAEGALANVPNVTTEVRLIATDGFMSLPGRRRADDNGLYAFGFRGVRPDEQNADAITLSRYKGAVQWPSPILPVPKDIDAYITLTNLGLVVRPDLDDSHTIHWHGFRNPNAIFDGVPEVSIAVPVARDFAYFYRPRVEGTYMYHCHFEDTEHVQMGMDGVAYIEALNGNAYDSDGGATAFDREFTFLLNEVDTAPHDLLQNVQEFIWSNYNPNYWVINGRSFPDTILRDQDLPGSDFDLNDPDLGYTQPVSSLMQLEAGETGLMRWVNLGYQQQAMELLGPPMTIVGHDATYLGTKTYQTYSIYIGPGETRDALVTAPPYDPSKPSDPNDPRPNNVYWIRNRNGQRLHNNGSVDPATGMGGQVTQLRVYPAGALGPQSGPNVTV